MPQRKKAVLITGGAGFLGSHLCDWFLQRDFRVVCLDNFLTGDRKNIGHLLKDKNFSLIKQDISQEIKISLPLDYVLHFASPASPVDYLKFPIPTLKAGSQGTLHSLELAKAKKAVYLLASTSEVYGDPQEHPQKETYWGHVNPVGPRAVYDEAKRFAEALTTAYRRSHKLDAKIARIFNTYGPRMRINDGRVVPNFIHQALHHQPLTVYGDGSQTRSFCYYSDLVEGVMRLLFSKIPGPVNLGNPREFSILEFSRLVIQFSRAKSKIVFKPLPVDDPKQRCPDIRLARKELHWTPKVPLQPGLKETIRWFKERP